MSSVSYDNNGGTPQLVLTLKSALTEGNRATFTVAADGNTYTATKDYDDSADDNKSFTIPVSDFKTSGGSALTDSQIDDSTTVSASVAAIG